MKDDKKGLIQRVVEAAQRGQIGTGDVELLEVLDAAIRAVDLAHSLALPIGRSSVSTILWVLLALLKTTRAALAEADHAQLATISRLVRRAMEGR